MNNRVNILHILLIREHRESTESSDDRTLICDVIFLLLRITLELL
jgi:hypothetical protein